MDELARSRIEPEGADERQDARRRAEVDEELGVHDEADRPRAEQRTDEEANTRSGDKVEPEAMSTDVITPGVPIVGPAPFFERRSTPDHRRLRPPTPRVALLLFAAILSAFVLYLGRDALSPFIVGLLLVYLLDPPVERLAHLGMPRWLAILFVYALAIFIVLEVASITLAPLAQQVTTFVQDLPNLAKSLDEQLRRLSEAYRGLNLPPQIRRGVDQAAQELNQRAATFDPTVLFPVFGSVAGIITTIFGYLLVPVWVFYLLKDRPQLTKTFDVALPPEWRGDVWEVIHITERVFSQWVRAQLFIGTTVAIFSYVGLTVLGNVVDPVFARFALLFAIIAGLFELLPIIGPILSAIPAVFLAITVSVEATVAVFGLYFVIQQVENNFLVPKIQGGAIELHPSVVMFALLVGAAIAGLLGAILALPITAAARNVFRYLFGRLTRGQDLRLVAEAATAEVAALSLSRGEGEAPVSGAAAQEPGPSVSTDDSSSASPRPPPPRSQRKVPRSAVDG